MKTGRKLQFILLSERIHLKKVTYCMIASIRHSGKETSMETVKNSVVARD